MTGIGAITADGTLTISGVATDITTASNEALTLAPNGTGSVVITSGATTGTGTASGLSLTAASLTTGSALTIAATNTATTNTALDQLAINLTNAQGTTGNADFTGLEIGYTQAVTTSGNTERAMRISATGATSPTDIVIDALLVLDNAEDVNPGTISVTDVLQIQTTGNAGAAMVNNAIAIRGTGVQTDLLLQNGETISNDTDGTIALTAPTVSISAALSVVGNTTLTGDAAINGGDLTTTATTFNILNTTATTVNFAGGATTVLNIGSTTTGLNTFAADVNMNFLGSENLALTSDAGGGVGSDVLDIDITPATGVGAGSGMRITNNSGAGAQGIGSFLVLEHYDNLSLATGLALITDNANFSGGPITNGLIMTSVGAPTGPTITTALNVSDDEIDTALAVGSNFVVFNDVALIDDTASVNALSLATGDSLTVINGAICVDNDGTCTSLTAGEVRADAFPTTGGDVAEMYFSSESLNPGEVVSLDLSGEASVHRSREAGGDLLVGVVATDPGVILSANNIYNEATRQNDPNYYPITLVGRVPVKVTDEGGAIGPGDYLTSSSTPGHAMKTILPSRVLGLALQSFTGPGVGYIDVFVQPGWYNGLSIEKMQNSASQMPVSPSLNSLDLSQGLDMRGGAIYQIRSLLAASGLWSLDENGKLVVTAIETEELVTEELTARLTDRRQMVGQGLIPAGSQILRMSNELIEADSKVFVTFRSRSPSDWWVSAVDQGSFEISLAEPTRSDLIFDYWIVRVEDTRAPTQSSPSETSSPEELVEILPLVGASPLSEDTSLPEEPRLEVETVSQEEIESGG